MWSCHAKQHFGISAVYYCGKTDWSPWFIFKHAGTLYFHSPFVQHNMIFFSSLSGECWPNCCDTNFLTCSLPSFPRIFPTNRNVSVTLYISGPRKQRKKCKAKIRTVAVKFPFQINHCWVPIDRKEQYTWYRWFDLLCDMCTITELDFLWK